MNATRRLVVASAIAVAAACTSDGPASTPAPVEPLVPLASDGIVTLQHWLDGGAAHVERAADTEFPMLRDAAEIVVLAPSGADETSDEVVAVTTVPEGTAIGVNSTTEMSLTPGMPCGSNTETTAVPGGLVRVGSRAATRDDLGLITSLVSVGPDRSLVIEPPPGWTEVGRLPAGWGTPLDGTMGADPDVYSPLLLVRRADPSMAAALRALLCAEPGSSLSPPASQPSDYFDALGRRTVDVGGVNAEVGFIATYAAVAFTDDRLLVFWPSESSEPTDADIRRLLADVVAVDLDEFTQARAALQERLGNELLDAYVESLPPSEEVLADGTLGGARWVLHAADDAELGPVVCFEVVAYPDGSAYAYHDVAGHWVCPVDALGAPGLAVGFAIGYSDTTYGFAEVPPASASVAGVDEWQLVDDERGKRYVVFSVPGQSGAWSTEPRAVGEDPVRLLLDGGVIVDVAVLDASGAVLAEDTFGG